MTFCSVENCEMPSFGKDKNTGEPFCKRHQYKRTDLDKRSIVQKAMAKHKEEMNGEVKEKSELDIWFEERRKEMTGRCLFCGGRTERSNEKTFKCSIAHLLAKRDTMFPSVATNPDNWVELCHFGNSCHQNFDNHILELEDFRNDKRVWPIIEGKFLRIYPFIAENEKRNLPEIFNQLVIHF